MAVCIGRRSDLPGITSNWSMTSLLLPREPTPHPPPDGGREVLEATPRAICSWASGESCACDRPVLYQEWLASADPWMAASYLRPRTRSSFVWARTTAASNWSSIRFWHTRRCSAGPALRRLLESRWTRPELHILPDYQFLDLGTPGRCRPSQCGTPPKHVHLQSGVRGQNQSRRRFARLRDVVAAPATTDSVHSGFWYERIYHRNDRRERFPHGKPLSRPLGRVDRTLS